MSSEARAARPVRGRLLLVGDDARFAELESLLEQTPLRTRNVFEAIAMLTLPGQNARGLRVPVFAVLVAADQLGEGRGGALAEALRRVDPSVDVIVVRQAQQPRLDHDAIARFDRAIGSDTPALAIAVELHQAVRPVQAPQAAAPGEARADSGAAAHREPAPAPAGLAAPRAPKSHQQPQPDRAQRAEAKAQAALGDTDLVEAVMDPDADFPAIALELLKQQTGWSDVCFETSAERPEPARDFAAVEHEGVRFGWLCGGAGGGGGGGRAEGIDERRVQAWAAWLARWMALHRSYAGYRQMAYTDDLTGAFNRRYYRKFLSDAIAQARHRRRPVTVMVFDLDNFKLYNDQFGHDAGDLVLTETVRLLKSVIRQGDRVCRIGGDEFVVIFADVEGPREVGSVHPETVEQIARRFQEQIWRMRFPKLGVEAPGSLSISAGLATFPWDGDDPDSLLHHADALALQSKRRGKNVITFGPRATCDHASEQPPRLDR